MTSVEEVLEHALVSPLVPIDWEEEDQEAEVPASGGDDDEERSGLVKH